MNFVNVIPNVDYEHTKHINSFNVMFLRIFGFDCFY